MSLSPVHPTRIRTLNDRPHNELGRYILYWMINSVRTRQNPALEHAAHLANTLHKPLHIIHLFPSTAGDGQPLTERHAAFQLEALIPVRKALLKRDVSFTVFAPGPDPAVVLSVLGADSNLVITDTSYLTEGIATRRDAARALRVPLVVVEGDVVVPVETASNKAEHAARTIRPKITRLLPQYLHTLQTVPLQYQDQADTAADRIKGWLYKLNKNKQGVHELAFEDVDIALEEMSGLDRNAPRVRSFIGGEDAAQKILETFLRERLPVYGKGRNDPEKELQSDLSPYLRMGNISPVDIALQTNEVRSSGTKVEESKASFLEELIVRRELAVNACWFNPGAYDVYEKIVPAFAQASLELHKADERPKIYTYEELEAGVTHDIFWNAAQHEMILRGKQHGYMRMYWVKQIIGWVADPAQAMDYAIRLNNRWELDAVDPNSYAGVIWCFGLHDQGWKERPIWGKVRYMNATGLQRKFKMAEYVAKVERMIVEQGLPPHISALRKKHKKGLRQTTVHSLKRTLSTSSSTTKRARLPRSAKPRKD